MIRIGIINDLPPLFIGDLFERLIYITFDSKLFYDMWSNINKTNITLSTLTYQKILGSFFKLKHFRGAVSVWERVCTENLQNTIQLRNMYLANHVYILEKTHLSYYLVNDIIKNNIIPNQLTIYYLLASIAFSLDKGLKRNFKAELDLVNQTNKQYNLQFTSPSLVKLLIIYEKLGDYKMVISLYDKLLLADYEVSFLCS